MFRALLDTCVLFKPLLCDSLLCLAEEGLFQPLQEASRQHGGGNLFLGGAALQRFVEFEADAQRQADVECGRVLGSFAFGFLVGILFAYPVDVGGDCGVVGVSRQASLWAYGRA